MTESVEISTGGLGCSTRKLWIWPMGSSTAVSAGANYSPPMVDAGMDAQSRPKWPRTDSDAWNASDFTGEQVALQA